MEKNNTQKISFRFAEKKDVPLILKFIKGLAEYEKASELVTATEELLEEWLFKKERAEVLFLLVSGKEAGFALFFQSFATYPGRGGIYIDDLYIHPEYRGYGYGRKFLKKLAQITTERGGTRMEWLCLNWNPSIDFYKSMGGKALSTCTTFRLEGESLLALLNDERSVT